MLTAKSTDVQNNFGEYLDKAMREPVTITKHGRPSALMLPYADYVRLNEIENMYWVLRSEQAEREGYIGTEETQSLLNQLKASHEKD